MTILISGGSGFLGQLVARALLKERGNAGSADPELLLVDIKDPAEPIPGAQHVT
jgi:uncharacterized protein YbjT (DUF2867 family)